ncbi:hypothetical protein PLA106_08995, partial [Pseudomonas amygdali pv. lachrymans str. M302278]
MIILRYLWRFRVSGWPRFFDFYLVIVTCKSCRLTFAVFCEILILLFDTTSLNMINSKFSVKLVRYKVTPCEVWGENYLWIIF